MAAERKLCGGAVKAATHEIDPGLGGGGGLFGGLDVDMRQDTLALELLEIIDGVFFARAEHGWSRVVVFLTNHRRRRFPDKGFFKEGENGDGMTWK